MKNARTLGTLAAALMLGALPASPQSINPGLPDPFRLMEPKNFVAFRSGSNNPDWNSNDDSKRPIPGETTVLADLEGPGVVDAHLADRRRQASTAGRGCCACASTTTAAPTPSVDAPLGDFFAVGHGFERPVHSLMVRDSSEGRSRNSYWPMPFRKSCRITVTNEGRRRVANLYYHVDWAEAARRSPRTRPTSTRATARPCPRRRRLATTRS